MTKEEWKEYYHNVRVEAHKVAEQHFKENPDTVLMTFPYFVPDMGLYRDFPYCYYEVKR